jgi:hypothetical protein
MLHGYLQPRDLFINLCIECIKRPKLQDFMCYVQKLFFFGLGNDVVNISTGRIPRNIAHSSFPLLSLVRIVNPSETELHLLM